MAVNKNFVVKNGLEVDTNLIFADPANKRVGIASTTPNYTLNVAGGIGATDLYISGVSTFIGIGTFSSDVYVDGNLNVVGDITYDEVTGRNLNITGLSTFEGNSYFGSSVGIGTTNPDSALHIQSPSASTTLTFTAPSGQPNKIQFQTAAGVLDAEIKNESNNLYFATGSTPTTRITLLSDGKVGIGTASPEDLLHLQSGSSGASSVGAAQLVLESSGSANWIHFKNPNTQNAGLIWSDAAATERAYINYDHNVDRMYFKAVGTANNLVLTGNKVGIGTGSPDNELHVFGATTSAIRIETGDGGYNPILMQENPDRIWHTGLRGDASDSWVVRDATAGSNRFVIDTVGEVRVGSAFSVGQAGVVTATSYYGDGSNLTDAGTSLGMVIALSG